MNNRLSSSRLQAMLRELQDSSAAIGLEGDGSLQREHELVFYAKLVRPEQLQQGVRAEHHEQWEIRTSADPQRRYFGSLRVRRTLGLLPVPTAPRFEMTLKSVDTQSASAGKDEVELDIPETVFELFKRLCNAGMSKTRYCFPVHYQGHDLMWEVDVFNDPCKPSQWCKLDLEIPEGLDHYPPFPVELTDVFDVQPRDRTPEQKAFVEKLMVEEFLQRNPFPSTDQQVTTTEAHPSE